MSNSAKDFCLVRNNLVKEIPQKAWIRYISKKNMIVNKGGMLLKKSILLILCTDSYDLTKGKLLRL